MLSSKPLRDYTEWQYHYGKALNRQRALIAELNANMAN
jgi:hypothetical protein